MFALGYRTPPAWALAAGAAPLELLSDHAHNELRAAASAQGLILRRPRLSRLVERLGALAAEELEHFRRVHRLLLSLGGSLGPPEPSPYVDGLLRGRGQLLERLLAAALIEARSLERFELLAEHLAEPLGPLYAQLAPSERGHAHLFVQLAEELFPEAEVGAALEDTIAREALLVAALPFAPRMHSGAPRAEPMG